MSGRNGRSDYLCRGCGRRLGVIRKFVVCLLTLADGVESEHIRYDPDKGDLLITCPDCGKLNRVRAKMLS